MSDQTKAESDKRQKAEPTEVRMIDVLIEVRALRGELFQLNRKVRELEEQLSGVNARTARIG